MKKLPSDDILRIMWTVATSSSIETREKPYIIFSKLLYDELSGKKPIVGLGTSRL